MKVRRSKQFGWANRTLYSLRGMALSSGLLSALSDPLRLKVVSQSEESQEAGGVIRQDFLQERRLSSWFQDVGRLGRVWVYPNGRSFRWTYTFPAASLKVSQVGRGVLRRAAESLVLSTSALLRRWRPPAPPSEVAACRPAQESCGRWRCLGATWLRAPRGSGSASPAAHCENCRTPGGLWVPLYWHQRPRGHRPGCWQPELRPSRPLPGSPSGPPPLPGCGKPACGSECESGRLQMRGPLGRALPGPRRGCHSPGPRREGLSKQPVQNEAPRQTGWGRAAPVRSARWKWQWEQPANRKQGGTLSLRTQT